MRIFLRSALAVMVTASWLWRVPVALAQAPGIVRVWGSNSNGQLGDGTTSNRSTPTSVSGLSGAVSVVGGAYHTLALLSDGSVRAWGFNRFGQLGDATTADRHGPVAVQNLTGV